MSEDDGNQSGNQPDRGPETPKPPDLKTYARWWRAYRDGARSGRTLSAKVKARLATCLWAINKGWPPEMPPLSERAVLFDRQQAAKLRDATAEKEKAAPVEVMAVPMDFLRSEAMRLSDIFATIRAGGGELAKKIAEAAPVANFVEYREAPELDEKGQQRRDGEGRPMKKLVPYVDPVAVAHAARLWASALKDATAMQVALDKLKDDGPVGAALAPMGHETLTEAHLERLRKGEIPDDLTPAQLAAALIEAERIVGGG